LESINTLAFWHGGKSARGTTGSDGSAGNTFEKADLDADSHLARKTGTKSGAGGGRATELEEAS